MTEKRTPMGRPPEPVPPGATVYRPYLRAPPDLVARLEEKAKASMRSASAELAFALRAYLEAHPKLPEVEPSDAGHGAFRPRLPADLVRTLDARAGIDDRERHIIAAIEWWVRR